MRCKKIAALQWFEDNFKEHWGDSALDKAEWSLAKSLFRIGWIKGYEDAIDCSQNFKGAV